VSFMLFVWWREGGTPEDPERPALTTAGPVADNHAPARAALRQGPGYVSQVIDAIRRMFPLARVALIPATMMRARVPFRKLNGPPPYGPQGRK
jgi:hypothetical protein